MVSHYHNSLSMYQKNYGANLSYQTHGWYPNYPPTHHHGNSSQYLGTASAGGGGGSLSVGPMQDSESVAPTMYYPHHHPMFTQSSPDWTGYDNFPVGSQNSSLLHSAMGPSTAAAIHLNQSLNSNNSSVGDNLSNGMPNVPPSPPITVNSNCSELSSPGVTNGGGSSAGHGGSSPHVTGGGHATNGNNSSGGGITRPKSPYEWMKKPSYQSQPHPGNYSSEFNFCNYFILFSLVIFFFSMFIFIFLLYVCKTSGTYRNLIEKKNIHATGIFDIFLRFLIVSIDNL